MAKDHRDMRDPSALGEALERLRGTRRFKGRPVTDAADAIDHVDKVPGALSLPAYTRIPRFNPSDSLLESTVSRRQQELRDRAANGDKYAISMLETGLPGDSDE